MSEKKREILFRGKRTNNGAWVEGALCLKDSDEPFGDMVDRPSIIKYDPPYDGFWFRVNPETVGQYTGLTDKNGKKIFEGDILSENGYLFVVVWDQPWAKFKLQHDGRCYQYPEWNRGVQMEIVGNIHDNPELLKEEPNV